MAFQNYSFSLDGSCPHCGKLLTDEVGSVKVEGHDACVDDDGVLAEHSEANFILTNPEPNVTCGYCGGVLEVTANEE